MAGAVDILAELDDADVDWLAGRREEQRLAPGERLVVAGARPAGLSIVVSGQMEVRAADGAALAMLGPGDIVGEVSFVDDGPAIADVVAITDVHAITVLGTELRAKLALDPGFSARFHRALAVFLAQRLRERQTGAAAPPAVLAGNVHLARARLDRLLARLRPQGEVVLTGDDLTVEAVAAVSRHGVRVSAPELVRERVARSRATLERAAARGEQIYGLNQSLGALRGFRIDAAENAAFQRNILRSHAVGVGEPHARDTVRAIMLARLNGMARGGSGVAPAVFDALLTLLNAEVHPTVPRTGSIGMSDLAPLAHLALPLLGEGTAEVAGRVVSGAEALVEAGLEPVDVSGKDALALCSANSASVGHAALVVASATDVLAALDVAAALSLEGYGAHRAITSLRPEVQHVRPHSGQLAAAETLRALLAGSVRWDEEGPSREPLSFRCVAQVHGACRDALAACRRVVETELNSTSDNPVVLVELDEVTPTAHFHPAGLSLALDGLVVALAQVATMSANRVLRLMTHDLSGLPAQLTRNPGPSYGLGVLQKTVTALDAEIRLLAAPASLGYLPVADTVEDHATMATLGVARADDLLECLRTLAACELLTAAQAVDLRGAYPLGTGTAAAHDVVRVGVATLDEDRVVAGDVASLVELVRSGRLIAAVNAAIAPVRLGLDAQA